MSANMIAVVIPTFNSARFIRETIESVFGQTHVPTEIIVVDDSSNDNTCEIVRESAVSGPAPVRLIQLPTNSGGPARPLNVGIECSQTTFVATLDHDDLMLPSRITSQLDCIRRNSAIGLVIGKCLPSTPGSETPKSALGANRCLERLTKEPLGGGCYTVPRAHAYERLHLEGNYALSCSSFLFRKSVWQQCGGFDERIRSSCDFAFIQAVAAKSDIGFVDEEVFVWHRGIDNLSSTIGQRLAKREEIEVISRFDPSVIPPETRDYVHRVARLRIREEFGDLAYMQRESGDYVGALRSYIESIRTTGFNTSALLGVIKLLPHRASRLLRVN